MKNLKISIVNIENLTFRINNLILLDLKKNLIICPFLFRYPVKINQIERGYLISSLNIDTLLLNELIEVLPNVIN